MTINSVNKSVLACSRHIHEFSANRIKDPFTGKWVNKTQAQFERILRHRSITEETCPSCERMVNYSHERESAGAKTETEGQPPAVAGRLDSDAAKGD